MSWSINFTGKPEKVVEALDNQAKELTGNSKEEFERALPNLKGLVSLNSNLLNNGLVRIEASGHTYQADDRLISNCIVKIEPVYGILV